MSPSATMAAALAQAALFTPVTEVPPPQPLVHVAITRAPEGDAAPLHDTSRPSHLGQPVARPVEPAARPSSRPEPAAPAPMALQQGEGEVGAVAEERAPKVRKERKMQMEVGFRLRRLSVPQGLLDIWYHDADTEGWPLPGEDRPHINGWAYGIEWGFKDNHTNGFLWVDWIDNSMVPGYWDDREEPADTEDGDYIVPAGNLGILAFGGDYGYEIDMVRLNQTKGIFGMSFLVGGGLGLGLLVGPLDEWSQGEDGTPAYVLYENGEPAQTEKKVPRVYPMVDVNLGLRFNFGDRIQLRLEGGIHTLLYYGGAVSVRF
jgi:hypothetical protein